MIAADSRVQSQGIGMALTEAATEWPTGSDMRAAMIDSGGD
jgi:hypothetical protein